MVYLIGVKNEAGYRTARLILNMEGDFRLTPPPSDDLVNTLFRDTESLGDADPSFTCLVARDDFGITFHLCGHHIVLRFGWE